MVERKSTAVRRAELADAALALVATRGIAALNTRALAEAVGLTTGALFRHYATLEDLLVGVADRAAQLLEATFPDRALPWRARLSTFSEARLALVQAHPGVPQLVLSDQFSLALPPEARDTLRRSVAATHQFLADALRDGQRAGDVRLDVEAEVLASLFIGALQMAVLTSRTTGKADPAPLIAILTLSSALPDTQEKKS